MLRIPVIIAELRVTSLVPLPIFISTIVLFLSDESSTRFPRMKGLLAAVFLH
jgi:hypothetical protein